MNNPFGGSFDKVDVINDAYSQLRISGLTVQPTPEDLELALDRLEVMASEWAERNICSNYNFEDEPDPNSITNVKRGYKQAFSTNLALRLLPDFGKEPPMALLSQATQSLSNLSARSAFERVQEVPYPTRMARGSGNTLRYNRWNRFYRNQGNAPNSCKTIWMFIGDVNDYVEHFDAFLDEGEVISSVQPTADDGINIESSSFTDTDYSYRIRISGNNESTQNDVRQLTLVMTTDAGRVETRVITFNISARPRQD